MFFIQRIAFLILGYIQFMLLAMFFRLIVHNVIYTSWFLITITAMSQARGLPQSKEALLKSYNKKLKDDIQSMLVNFEEIIKLARVSAPVPTQFPNIK